MAQHDYDINSSDAISGLQFRQDVNNVLSAIKSSNSGATAPTTYIAGTIWLDTSTTPHILKKRNTANTGWDTIRIEDALGAPIASGATTTVGTYSGGNTVHITGTTTITSLGVSTTGTTRTLIFDSALTITHNATSLICPNGLSITIASGDAITVICEDGALGYWKVSSISRLMPSELSYLINATTAKTTPIDADKFGIWDSVSGLLNSVSFANLKSTLFSSKPSGENLLINSNGLVNQRGYISGTATIAANQYTIDMFRIVTLGQNLTFSTTAGVTTFTAPAGGVDLPIENINIIGGSYVLSFIGTATSVVSQSADNITYTTVTPISGIYTITGGYYVRVRLLGGTFNKIKFEEGIISTPYSLSEFSKEDQCCQRYLPVIKGNYELGQCTTTTSANLVIKLNIQPRINPNGISYTAPVGNFSITNGAGSATPLTSLTFAASGYGSLILSAIVASGLIAGNATFLYTAGNKILLTGCEL